MIVLAGWQRLFERVLDTSRQEGTTTGFLKEQNNIQDSFLPKGRGSTWEEEKGQRPYCMTKNVDSG